MISLANYMSSMPIYSSPYSSSSSKSESSDLDLMMEDFQAIMQPEAFDALKNSYEELDPSQKREFSNALESELSGDEDYSKIISTAFSALNELQDNNKNSFDIQKRSEDSKSFMNTLQEAFQDESISSKVMSDFNSLSSDQQTSFASELLENEKKISNLNSKDELNNMFDQTLQNAQQSKTPPTQNSANNPYAAATQNSRPIFLNTYA